MKIIITQVIDANNLSLDDAKEIALIYRRSGFRTEIVSDDTFSKFGLSNPNQQDLTKIESWGQIK